MLSLDAFTGPAKWAVRLLWIAGVAGLLVFLTAAAGGPGDPQSPGYARLYVGLLLVPAALCVLRGLLVRDQRLAWLASGIGMACFAAGEGHYFAALQDLRDPPYPSWSDALWLTYYAASAVGLLMLMHAGLSKVRRGLWIDAAVGGLAIATLGAALLMQPLLAGTGGSRAAVATNLAYPLFDVLILSLLFGGFVFSGWRPGRVWTLLTVAWTLQAAVDVNYLLTTAGGNYEFGTALDVLWPAVMALVAFAAWQRPTVTKGAWVQGWGELVVTISFAVVGLSVLAYDHWSRVEDVAIVLATLTLAAAFVRTAMTFGEMRTLADGRELLLQNELILNSAGEGIVGIDADGAVTFANPAAARMTQYAAEAMAGRSLHDLLHHTKADGTPYPPAESPMVTALLNGTSRRSAEEVIWRKDGTHLPIEYTSTPIADGAHSGGAVVVFRDVTERRDVERVKDQFVSVVSHELRTPLTAIRGSLGLLESGALGPLPDRGQRMIEIAVQNTDRLVRLINDILDLERLDSAAIDVHPVRCDAAQLIARATDVTLPVAAEAGVTLAVDAVPAALVADPDRLIQTLTNLITNAVKFSPAGSTVRIISERRGDEILFRVSDQGRGIPAAKLETIFERFQQVDASDSRQSGGTGLGLAICRNIVAHHGGRIWAHSVPGEGSTFSFLVPAPPDDANVYTPRDDGRLGLSVLVCEDDASVVEVVGTTLAERGFDVIAAPTGELAITRAIDERPDVILLDLQMPGMSGREIAAALQQHAETASIPIVILSVLPPSEHEMPDGRVVDWLEKPAGDAALVAALTRAIQTPTPEAGHEPEAHPARR